MWITISVSGGSASIDGASIAVLCTSVLLDTASSDPPITPSSWTTEEMLASQARRRRKKGFRALRKSSIFGVNPELSPEGALVEGENQATNFFASQLNTFGIINCEKACRVGK